MFRQSVIKIMKLILVTLLIAGHVHAHEFWVSPKDYSPKTGEFAVFQVYVGGPFAGVPQVRNQEHLSQFDLIHIGNQDDDSLNSIPIIGRHGSFPTGAVKPLSSGLTAVRYVSTPNSNSMTLPRFLNYLATEGMHVRVPTGVFRDKSNTVVNEDFIRSAKSLIAVNGDSTGEDTYTGMPLEFVMQQNPYTLKSGDKFKVQLLFKNKPLTHKRVSFVSKTNRGETQHGFSDAEGMVEFRVTSEGPYLLHTIHLVHQEPWAETKEAATKSATAPDYVSYWGTLTWGALKP